MHRTPVDTLAALGKGVGNKKKICLLDPPSTR